MLTIPARLIGALIVAGRTIGRHYPGPHWALDDGSLIQSKGATSVPGATAADVALLKLAVIANGGQGALGVGDAGLSHEHARRQSDRQLPDRRHAPGGGIFRRLYLCQIIAPAGA